MESLDALEDSLLERQLKTEIHNILKNNTVSSASRLERLRFHSKWKSKSNISLYMMVSLFVVRSFSKKMSWILLVILYRKGIHKKIVYFI